MNWFTIIFPAFVVLIILTIFTKRGRNLSVQMTFGRIEKDYGNIGQATKVNGLIKQSLRLLQCSKNGEMFYVLETRGSSFLSFNIFYTKITLEAAEKIIAIIKQDSPIA
jgi:hypothetical protein